MTFSPCHWPVFLDYSIKSNSFHVILFDLHKQWTLLFLFFLPTAFTQNRSHFPSNHFLSHVLIHFSSFFFAKKDKNGLLYISTVKKNIPYWYVREPDKRFDLERMRPSSSLCVCIFRTHYAIQLNKESVPVIFIPCSTSQMDECLSQQFLDKIRGMMQWCVLYSSESVALLFSFCIFPFPV